MNFSDARFEKAFGTFRQLEQSDLPEICFAGRSNVGKSTLINKVLGRKSIARVSSKPGKTVTVNFYRVGNVRLADLPGYGYARVSDSEKDRWSGLMEGYFNSGRNIKLVFVLMDMRHPATDFDLSMLKYLKSTGYRYALILTKSDKLNKSQTLDRLTAAKDELGKYLERDVQLIPFSALNGSGVQEIRDIISDISDEDSNEL